MVKTYPSGDVLRGFLFSFAFDEFSGDSAEEIATYYVGFAIDGDTFAEWIPYFNGEAGNTNDEKLNSLVSEGKVKKIDATAGSDGAPTPIGTDLTKTIAGAPLADNTPYEEFVITYDSAGNGIVEFGQGIDDLVK